MGIGIRKAIGKINESLMAKKSRESVREAHTKKRINTLLSTKSSFSTIEAYKAIRTNIIFTLGSEHDSCKKIIITSAIPGEGKTTTCLNLAIAFAQTGAKVIVLDADLRKPRIYRHLSLEKNNGLSDYLGGMITELDKVIKTCNEHGIDCITSGQTPPNPVELMSSKRMELLLDELSKKYDYVFIDTAPVTVVTDATAIANYVDGVVVVARQNYTIHESLQRAIVNLKFANVKILGYILNDVSAGAQRYGGYKRYGGKYGYGHGHGYGYGYGYGYGNEYGDHSQMETTHSTKTPKLLK